MAQPVSYTKNPNDGDVLLEMVEPSFHAKGSEPKGLYLEDAGPNKKIDYALVYERCQEKEHKDDDAKEKAEKLEGMRKSFEASLEGAGLVIERKEYILPQVRLFRVVTVKTLWLAQKYILLVHLEIDNIERLESFCSSRNSNF